MTTTDLQRLRELAKAATPGPYTRRGFRIDAGEFNRFEASGKQRRANAAYIAAMHPQTTLALLDEIDRLNAGLERRLQEACVLRVNTLSRKLAHAGRKLLEEMSRDKKRLEAAEKVCEAAIAIGCGCSKCRPTREAVAAWRKTRDDAAKDGGQ